jgi:hypothetical protein
MDGLPFEQLEAHFNYREMEWHVEFCRRLCRGCPAYAALRATVARHPVGGVCPGVWRLAHSLCLFCTPKKDPSLAEFASSLTLLDYAGQYTHIRYGLGLGTGALNDYLSSKGYCAEADGDEACWTLPSYEWDCLAFFAACEGAASHLAAAQPPGESSVGSCRMMHHSVLGASTCRSRRDSPTSAHH